MFPRFKIFIPIYFFNTDHVDLDVRFDLPLSFFLVSKNGLKAKIGLKILTNDFIDLDHVINAFICANQDSDVIFGR